MPQWTRCAQALQIDAIGGEDQIEVPEIRRRHLPRSQVVDRSLAPTRQRPGAPLATPSLGGGHVLLPRQHIGGGHAATLLRQLVDARRDTGFEPVEQPPQPTARPQHRDRLGGTQRGDVARQHRRQIEVRVVRHVDDASRTYVRKSSPWR